MLVFLPQTVSALAYQALWPLWAARGLLLLSQLSGAQTSVLDMSEQLIVCQTVIKCMSQTSRTAQIKASISCPELFPQLSGAGNRKDLLWTLVLTYCMWRGLLHHTSANKWTVCTPFYLDICTFITSLDILVDQLSSKCCDFLTLFSAIVQSVP